jgi:hypothetical protein
MAKFRDAWEKALIERLQSARPSSSCRGRSWRGRQARPRPYLRGFVTSAAAKAAAKPKAPGEHALDRRRGRGLGRMAKLRARIRGLQAQLRMVTRSPRNTVFIAAADRRKIRAALRPDRAKLDPVTLKERLTKASQIFNALPLRVLDFD